MSSNRVTLTLAALTLAACTKDEGGAKQAPGAPPAAVTAPAAADAKPTDAKPADVKPTEAAATPGDASAKPTGEMDVAALVPGPQATELAAKEIKLPPQWKGTGVLQKRADKLPRRAPAWAGIAAQVVEHDGKRFLVTTGRVSKIKDAQLARSTAENRARDEAKRWTRVDRQEGGAIREIWRDPRSGDTFAQVELPVPPEWMPGTPLGN
jgi:hypothetical protein